MSQNFAKDDLEELMEKLQPTSPMNTDSDSQQSQFSEAISSSDDIANVHRQRDDQTTVDCSELTELLKRLTDADDETLWNEPTKNLLLYYAELRRQTNKDYVTYQEYLRGYEKLLRKKKNESNSTLTTIVHPIEIPQLPIKSVEGYKSFEKDLAELEKLLEDLDELINYQVNFSDLTGHQSIWRCLTMVLDHNFAKEWCTMQGRARGAKTEKNVLVVGDTLFWKKIQGIIVAKFTFKGYGIPDALKSGQKWINNKSKAK